MFHCGIHFPHHHLRWNFTTLYKFPVMARLGCVPDSTLIQHTNGRLYGTTANWWNRQMKVTFFSLDLGLGPS